MHAWHTTLFTQFRLQVENGFAVPPIEDGLDDDGDGPASAHGMDVEQGAAQACFSKCSHQETHVHSVWSIYCAASCLKGIQCMLSLAKAGTECSLG